MVTAGDHGGDAALATTFRYDPETFRLVRRFTVRASDYAVFGHRQWARGAGGDITLQEQAHADTAWDDEADAAGVVSTHLVLVEADPSPLASTVGFALTTAGDGSIGLTSSVIGTQLTRPLRQAEASGGPGTACVNREGANARSQVDRRNGAVDAARLVRISRPLGRMGA